jgi:hypothetical protein
MRSDGATSLSASAARTGTLRRGVRPAVWGSVKIRSRSRPRTAAALGPRPCRLPRRLPCRPSSPTNALNGDLIGAAAAAMCPMMCRSPPLPLTAAERNPKTSCRSVARSHAKNHEQSFHWVLNET